MEIKKSLYVCCRALFPEDFVSYRDDVRALFDETCLASGVKARLIYDGVVNADFVVVYSGADVFSFIRFVAVFQASIFEQYRVIITGVLSLGDFVFDGDAVVSGSNLIEVAASLKGASNPDICLDYTSLANLCNYLYDLDADHLRNDLLVVKEKGNTYSIQYDVYYVNYIEFLRPLMLADGKKEKDVTAEFCFWSLAFLPNVGLRGALEWIRKKICEVAK